LERVAAVVLAPRLLLLSLQRAVAAVEAVPLCFFSALRLILLQPSP